MGKISVVDAVKIGSEIWMLDGCINCLFSYDEEKGELDYAACVDNGYGNVMEYGTIEKNKERLFLFPIYADNIAVFHLDTRKTDFIRLPKSFLELPACNDGYGKIAFTYTYKNYIYAFGADYPGILALDTNTGDMACICVAEQLNGLLENPLNEYFSHNYAVSETVLYVPVKRTHYICMFCLDNMTFEIIPMDSSALFEGCCLCGGRLWLVHYREHKVTIVDKENMKALEVISIDRIAHSEFCDTQIHCFGQNVYIHTDQNCIEIRMDDKKIKFREFSEEEKSCTKVKIFDHKIYRFTIGNVLIWSEMNGIESSECFKLQMDGAESAGIFKEMIRREKDEEIAFTESYFLGLPELLGVIEKKDTNKKCRQNVGKDIFDMVRLNMER